VELALILPVMLLLFGGALDLGRLFYSQITITDAAREGVLEAISDPSSFALGEPCDPTSNRVMCRVINESSGSFYTVSPNDVSLTCYDTTGAPLTACPTAPVLGDTVSVKVTGQFSFIMGPLVCSLLPNCHQDSTTHAYVVPISETAQAQLAVAPVVGAPTPTPSPTASPTPSPTATPTPSPTASPTPSPTPVCIAPVVSVSANPTSGYAYWNNGHPGTTFSFKDNSTGENQPGCAVTWSWNFGDGGGSLTQNPTHVYSAPGTGASNTYTVTLVVTVGGQPGAGTTTITVVAQH
jgi:Flp pilus assembly protein TadG